MVSLSIDAYLDGSFSDLAHQALMFQQYTPSFRHHGPRVVRIFKRFYESRFSGQVITVRHMVAFLLYRVVGEGNDSDEHSGSVALASFFSIDLYPLVTYLRASGEIDFEVTEVTGLDEFRRQVGLIRRYYDDPDHASSRIIWIQDELRLRACFNFDTASKRDEAILILMLRSGFRAESISQINWENDVRIEEDGTVLVMLAMAKSSFDRDYYFPLVGEDAVLFRRYYYHRRKIFVNVKNLFICSRGGPITCDHITRMLNKLCQSGGYGIGFFTSQSFRRSYANRIASEVYASGGSVVDATKKIADGCRWHLRSKIAEKYLDKNVPTYFRGGRGLSLDEFREIKPEIMHGLRPLPPVTRRPITWICQPDEWLRRSCLDLSVPYTENNFQCRIRMGEKLMEVDHRFRAFVHRASEVSKKAGSILLHDAVGCLLEDCVPQLDSWMAPSRVGHLFAAVCAKEYTGGTLTQAERPLRVKVHVLMNRLQALKVVAKIRKAIYDRKLHLGRLPSGELVLIKVRPEEANCIDAQYRPIDIINDFPSIPLPTPVLITSVLSSPTPAAAIATPSTASTAARSVLLTPPHTSPSIPITPSTGTSHIPSTPANARITTPNTPSTAATDFRSSRQRPTRRKL